MSYYNLEAEQSVLGSIIKQPDLIYESLLSEEEFFNESHQIIFSAMVKLRSKEIGIDVVTLSNELKDGLSDVGGVSYLIKLSESVPSVSDFATHERIVKDRYLMRNGMQAIKEISSSGINDPKELAAELMDLSESLADQSRSADGFKHISQGIMEHSDEIDRKKYEGKAFGASTVGNDLDEITGKWKKQTLNIVAARPSVGKTAFLLNNAVRNGKDGLTVAIFSLEMPDMQLYDRMIAAECNIDGHRVEKGQLEDHEWEKYTLGLSELSQLDIYIDDRPGLSVQEIRSAVRKLKKKCPELIVFIDYLQLIKGGSKYSSKNRNEEVGFISSSLKQMARENDCPVVALAQLSRTVEQRQDKRPMMSDLRESGNIEQDADTITFLYRDDYYNAETEKKNIIEMIVSKNRNGRTGTAEMVNMKNYGKFLNYDRSHIM
ncbi:replicative DNA helicase [Paenibacillus polysaccharolyticus]|uniref:replicative DNA helicase n=1 Tax=Paenibacillus polysaccharolyticus TaxID=582692 RepID=UPI00203D5B20|nr:replicative DNA helicase [Paenibacillus polysaccharolyticus]MCM3131855.1 replicative DNA helicase [Paenibacillus polysaccharolyticus]